MAAPYRTRQEGGEGSGFGIVVGLLIFLLVIGMVGWTTQPTPPPPRLYPHTCQRYEVDDEEEDDDWEEYYEPPAVPNKPGTLKTTTAITKKAQDIIRRVIQTRVDRRPKPKPKPKPVLKTPGLKPEGYDPRQKKKARFQENDIQSITIKSI